MSGAQEYAPYGRWVPSAALAKRTGTVQVLRDRVERVPFSSQFVDSLHCWPLRGYRAKGSRSTPRTGFFAHSPLMDVRAAIGFGLLKLSRANLGAELRAIVASAPQPGLALLDE